MIVLYQTAPQVIAQNSLKQGGCALFIPFNAEKGLVEAHPPCFKRFYAVVEQK